MISPDSYDPHAPIIEIHFTRKSVQKFQMWVTRDYFGNEGSYARYLQITSFVSSIVPAGHFSSLRHLKTFSPHMGIQAHSLPLTLLFISFRPVISYSASFAWMSLDIPFLFASSSQTFLLRLFITLCLTVIFLLNSPLHSSTCSKTLHKKVFTVMFLGDMYHSRLINSSTFLSADIIFHDCNNFGTFHYHSH